MSRAKTTQGIGKCGLNCPDGRIGGTVNAAARPSYHAPVVRSICNPSPQLPPTHAGITTTEGWRCRQQMPSLVSDVGHAPIIGRSACPQHGRPSVVRKRRFRLGAWRRQSTDVGVGRPLVNSRRDALQPQPQRPICSTPRMRPPSYSITAISQNAHDDVWEVVCGFEHRGQGHVATRFFAYEQQHAAVRRYVWGIAQTVIMGRMGRNAQDRGWTARSLDIAARSARQIMNSMVAVGEEVLDEQIRVVRDRYEDDHEEQGGPVPPYSPANTAYVDMRFGDVPLGHVPSYTPFGTRPIYDAKVESLLRALDSAMDAIIFGLRAIQQATGSGELVPQQVALLNAIRALGDRLAEARVALNELVPIAAGVVCWQGIDREV
ncbi:hypothetical protein PENSPDRAFT_740168 [Peniophora sp. CONT]|nr:hypothetical protein PENSPDRAFT_740168 [Peniophora sp. CONT]